MCEYLTKDTQMRVFTTAERDDQGSKVADFFSRHDDMFHVSFLFLKKILFTLELMECFLCLM